MSGRRTEQHQYYMDFAPLLLYFAAMIIKQAKGSLESIEEVDNLIEKLSKKELYSQDCKLYTPSVLDYRNCSKSTIECFLKEVNVLIKETNAKDQGLLTLLKKIVYQLQDKKPPCPACEVYKEQKPEDFLKSLKTILQMMNTINELQ
ncbi:interleukin 15, like isoform X2 [Hoplias malabaricus]|uniref:interleukin 15, like isoform X2 n=1 Tax=Hoplias malabaricus TaxID=27720 RepID=UPI0034625D26